MNSPLKAIRDKCLDCATTAKMVRFCPCHGKDGTACALWPFRFGKRPNTMKRGADAQFLDPEKMPLATVPSEECDAEASDLQKHAEGRPVASASDALEGSVSKG